MSGTMICESNCENKNCERNLNFAPQKECVMVKDFSHTCPDYKGTRYCNVCGKPLTSEEIKYYGTTCDQCEREQMDELICPECGSDEIYYENPTTGNGLYNCDECGFFATREAFQ